MAAQGLADGNYRIGPQQVTVEGGRAYVTGTKVLCGSTTGLDECVATFKQSLGKLKMEPCIPLVSTIRLMNERSEHGSRNFCACILTRLDITNMVPKGSKKKTYKFQRKFQTDHD